MLVMTSRRVDGIGWEGERKGGYSEGLARLGWYGLHRIRGDYKGKTHSVAKTSVFPKWIA